MVKNGTIKINFASALQVMNGLELLVKRHFNVVEIEFGTQFLNIVSVLIWNTGMEEAVLLSLFALEVEDGILIDLNAFVLEHQNGIQKNVKLVEMGKYGMNLLDNVYVQEVQFGIITFVELFNNVVEEWCGSNKFGLANAL